MKTAILATLLATAAAFAPTPITKASTTTALSGAFDNEIGAASPELGCWDPLGYVSNGDQARFDRLRYVELKHGRIAQLAAWGYATTWSGARFPGCEDFPAGHDAVLKIAPVNLIPVLVVAGALELTFKQKDGSFPGDFSATAFPVGFGPFARNEADMIDLRTKELNNGRAAMMGILGMMVHEQIDGKPFIFFDKFDIYTPFGN
mmetsp:Transcript_26178/g.54874  ORF Transcript_26178/g.54874 Transcript_26178/m.54874 type:complete len:204 (-) Transcript_26178:360-971(-)|eukprot:CAMPEP_0171328092 /NCGR_PEP_ID=MMETSP0878-20121228/436_1 /TAXON_ID=67004 /ORGANISM="Thalassiosira weissflogii, Strain CCMP1336" /LENGTH=203 /DNA_ID=CAMNT_0011827919 /DNA_START=75 /DNA_END=686 /DNA_ORIENTATION=-